MRHQNWRAAVVDRLEGRRRRDVVLASVKSGAKGDMKRKIAELMEFSEWEETPRSRQYLALLLETLVYTGLMPAARAAAVQGWHDLCAAVHPDDWLSAADMRAILAKDELPGDYLPVTTVAGASLIPVNDAWFSPRLGKCYQRSELLQWTATFRQEKSRQWPMDASRNELSLAELFSLGADPFNAELWQPPLLQRAARLAPEKIAILNDTERMLAAAVDPENGPDEGLTWLQRLGQMPAAEQPAAVPPPPLQPAPPPPIIDAGPVRVTNVPHWIKKMAWSVTTNNVIAVPSTGNLSFVDASSGEQIRPLSMHGDRVTALDASGHDGIFFVGTNSGQVIGYKALTDQIFYESRTFQGVTSLARSPDGRVLAVGNYNGVVDVVRVTPLALDYVHQKPLGSIPFAMAFSPDGLTLAVGAQNGLRTTSPVLYEEPLRYRFYGATPGVRAIVWFPDNVRFATAHESSEIRIWSHDTGNELGRLNGHTGPVTCLALSEDGRIIVSGSLDRTVRVWQTATRTMTHTLVGHTRGITSVVLRPDGSRVISAASDNTIRSWPVPVIPD